MSLAASAFRSYVRRSDDARLERTFGAPRGLRFLFTRMARAYVPAAAEGLTGELELALRASGPQPTEDRAWTLVLSASGAVARPGPATSPVVVLRLTVPTLVRIAAGDADPGRALLDGRLDVEGDFAVVSRLGAMFGRPGAGVV